MSGRSRARDRGRGKSDGAQWSPARLADLRAWYRADQGPSGSPISSWSEYPGGRGDAATQGTLANRPLAAAARSAGNNQLASRFDATDFLTGTADIDCSAGLTVITVIETLALKNLQALLRIASHETNNVSGGICVYGVSTGAMAVRNTDAGSSWFRTYPTTALAGNALQVMLLKFGGSFATLSLQMASVSGSSLVWATQGSTSDFGTPALPASTGNKLILGAGWSDPGGLLNGYFFEQVVINRVISADEETAAKAYLEARYTT